MVQSTAEVLKERGTRYGQFINQAGIAQGFHSVFQFGMELSGKTKHKDFHVDELEALNMIFNKLARITNGDPHYSDSWRDIAGYATLVADRLDNDNAKQKLIEAQHNDRTRAEATTDKPDNEPSQARRDVGQEKNTTVGSVGRPTGRTELRRLPINGTSSETRVRVRTPSRG